MVNAQYKYISPRKERIRNESFCQNKSRTQPDIPIVEYKKNYKSLKTNNSFFTQTVFNMAIYIHQTKQQNERKQNDNQISLVSLKTLFRL